jgi:peptidoglycan hydrolase-like protein with peptidoglycan-binding domain
MPKTLKQQKPDRDVVTLQNLLAAQGYFSDAQPVHGIFERATHDNVVLFQLQHIGQDGKQLDADGVVGARTWWALKNPVGDAQRNHFRSIIPAGLSDLRKQLLENLLEEYHKPVFESPNGSNRSPDIDRYWGNSGVIGLPWCCAFVSWALQDTLGRYPIDNQHHLGVQRMWRSARRLGMQTSQAKPGDVFIQIKANGKGHTGFVAGVSADGEHIYSCEGNCGNRLKLGKRSIASIDHFIDCLEDHQDDEFERLDFDIGDVGREGTR